MIYGADKTDPLKFVVSTGDSPSRVDITYSPAELDALVAAAIVHMRNNGRDVVLLERQPETEQDA